MSDADTIADLSPARLNTLLETRWCGRTLEVLAETGSTNDDARGAGVRGAANGHVVIADRQTQGRGSRGRSWLSPAGTDLYFSLVLRPEGAIGRTPSLTLAIGVALAEAIDQLLGTPERAQVKWPNDVWIARNKVAGILVESSSLGEQAMPLVIGVGLNVNRAEFPADLDHPASSLALSGQQSLDRAVVFACVLGRIEHWLDRYAADGVGPVVAALNARLALRGERARVDAREGTVRGVDEQGALLLETSEGISEIVTGTLRPLT